MIPMAEVFSRKIVLSTVVPYSPRPDYSIVTSINGSGEDPVPPSTWVTTGTAVCTGDDVYVRRLRVVL